ncbi:MULTISPECIES: hypothetical protein [Streptosporangium]|uniref:Uncharacterized protein n=1 Tax=Streptosporangium brasiliense TaxID=47480 RepID=A0ABT9QZQ1_9ACTN|nr:hypothetical protein [Streptosporangium brasiliense]MDP9862468.1 hypothetical protein [Streptosporangium brasiliense]
MKGEANATGPHVPAPAEARPPSRRDGPGAPGGPDGPGGPVR